jgi:CRP-like cAMP-binding protein
MPPSSTPSSLSLKNHAAAPFNPLLRRLEEYTELSTEAREALAILSAKPPVRIGARRDLIRQGATPRYVYLISQGWACRYKSLPDGRRQIVDFLIPGDLCDLNIYILSRIDHSIGAITVLDVIEIPREELETITETHPQITRALWWQELVSKSCHREWIVNVGARSAMERLAHLLCEMFLRLESIGATNGHSCDFPLTQGDLADATGLTSVHVNRTLQRLREKGLITLVDRQLVIPDMSALKTAGLFNPDYLHLERLQRHTGAKERPGETARPWQAPGATISS